ncbi:hypothetical protein [Streptomyces violaceusniger]|uniref:Uncharacterized protein n=1 Tax=Streptomyces violaceusniger (strain Tu 4113) TaxID=653045 RepID=G2P0I7_STRV4|nr:hypothetical protein [Streptomyces violaceusniger]AEM85985.1 hypothetical protein Strvi_6595 [Streptomyces violaceusniger Tu 4113]
MFGANGYDGGLKGAVLSDPYVRELGDVAHALDSSEERTKLPGAPEPDDDRRTPPVVAAEKHRGHRLPRSEDDSAREEDPRGDLLLLVAFDLLVLHPTAEPPQRRQLGSPYPRRCLN